MDVVYVSIASLAMGDCAALLVLGSVDRIVPQLEAIDSPPVILPQVVDRFPHGRARQRQAGVGRNRQREALRRGEDQTVKAV